MSTTAPSSASASTVLLISHFFVSLCRISCCGPSVPHSSPKPARPRSSRCLSSAPQIRTPLSSTLLGLSRKSSSGCSEASAAALLAWLLIVTLWHLSECCWLQHRLYFFTQGCLGFTLLIKHAPGDSGRSIQARKAWKKPHHQLLRSWKRALSSMSQIARPLLPSDRWASARPTSD